LDYTDLINRDRDVSFLKDILSRSSFRSIPLRGLKRIGKTILLLNSTKNETFYFLATESTSIEDLKRFGKDIEKLMEKSRRIRWGNKRTKWTYLYISRGGFFRDCLRWMDEEGIMHWNLEDIEEILWNDEKSLIAQ
jgi:AAA+ ATPase superfamily predicted ATPase